MNSPTSEHPLLTSTTGETGGDRAVDEGAREVEGKRPAASRWTVAGRPLVIRRVASVTLIVAGFVAIVVGWYGVSGTSQVWQQIPYFVSGGIGGAALVGVGVAFHIAHLHAQDRRVMKELARRLDELELGLAGEFDSLSERLNGAKRGRRESR